MKVLTDKPESKPIQDKAPYINTFEDSKLVETTINKEKGVLGTYKDPSQLSSYRKRKLEELERSKNKSTVRKAPPDDDVKIY